MSDSKIGSPVTNIKLGIMMFLQFFVWGSWYVSQTGYMLDKGLGDIISNAYAVGPIAAIISPLFLGLVADRFFPSQKVFGFMHILGALFIAAIPTVIAATDAKPDAGFLHPYSLLLLGHMLCFMPTMGLGNTVAFAHISNGEKVFPLIRVFGTIGWIAGNWAVTFLPQGDKSPEQFYLTAGAGILLGVFSMFALPHTAPPLAGKKVTITQALGLEAFGMLKDKSFALFVLCSFLICIPLAGYYAYARNFVEFAGVSNPTGTMSFGQISEIFFMLVMPLFFARLGIKWMLAVGMLAWVVRYGLFYGAADSKAHFLVLGGILLHGICYDFFFVTGQIYTDKKAPAHLRGQAQGMLVLFTLGIGMFLGSKLFGYLVTKSTNAETKLVDWKQVWLTPCLAALAILVFFALFFRDKPVEQKARETGASH